jgi:hypothetical protein
MGRSASTEAVAGRLPLRLAKEERRDYNPGSLLKIVHLGSVVERRPRACSVENAEVELERDHRELRCRIAWRSERLAGSAARTAPGRPDREPGRR